MVLLRDQAKVGSITGASILSNGRPHNPKRVLWYKRDVRGITQEIDLKRWAIAPLFFSLVACTSPTKLGDIAYDERFGQSTRMDLYLPEGTGPHPAVVLIHGGLFVRGDKSDLGRAAERLALSGYVAATVNHRLSPGATYPMPLNDIGCALSFLRKGAEDYKIAPDRIALLGVASGGYFASMLGVLGDSQDLAPDCEGFEWAAPQAVIASAALFDLVDAAGEPEVQKFMGGTLNEMHPRYEQASPLFQVKNGAAPHLLIHGEIDWVVPSGQSKKMAEKLVESGNEVQFLSLADPGHFLAAGADNGGLYGGGVGDRPESWIALIDFLEQTIGAP